MVDDYSPQNDKDTLYIYTGINAGGTKIDFADLLVQIAQHFGEDISLSDLDITSERLHTRAIRYDLYDAFDYDTYLIITRKY